MLRLIFLTIIFCISVGEARLCENATTSTSQSPYFNGIADPIIHGYGYRNLTGISVIRCGNLCLSDTRCFSINYSERDKLCELNGATASQYPSALLEWGGSYYYRPEKPKFMKQLQLFQTKIGDSHDLASAECQRDGKHLCQPWEIHQAFKHKAGKFRDVPTAISFWYSVPNSKILVNATGLTYQELHHIDTPYPIITNECYDLDDCDGQTEACSDLDAHLCTLSELKEVYLMGYRQPCSSWLYLSNPQRDAQLYNDNCGGGDYTDRECYEGIVANTPRPYPSAKVFCCPFKSEESPSPAMCCPGLLSSRDPIITSEMYAKENRNGMASACSALNAHLCTLAELKEAYLRGYRQPLYQHGSCKALWLFYSEPDRNAKLFNDGCSQYLGVTNECYEGIVANTPRPADFSQVLCCQ